MNHIWLLWEIPDRGVPILIDVFSKKHLAKARAKKMYPDKYERGYSTDIEKYTVVQPEEVTND